MIPRLLVAVTLLIGTCSSSSTHAGPRGGAPRGWAARIDAARVGPACQSMIGRSYRAQVSLRRSDPAPGGIDLTDPEVPAVIRQLKPLRVVVTEDHVEITMGRFKTRRASDEHDFYGLVCFRGTSVPLRYRDMNGTSFLERRGHGLHSFDSIL